MHYAGSVIDEFEAWQVRGMGIGHSWIFVGHRLWSVVKSDTENSSGSRIKSGFAEGFNAHDAVDVIADAQWVAIGAVVSLCRSVEVTKAWINDSYSVAAALVEGS